MVAKRCWDCQTTFNSDYGAIYCNVCHQARETRKYNERQSRQAQWEAEQAQRALINAENQRIAAINYQTQVIQESAVTTKYAYDRGYTYIDDEFGYSNPAELEIEVNEDGSLEWKWNHLYLTDRLNTEFKKGLNARLNQHKNIFSTIKASAKRIGKGNADGSFPSTHFNLYTGLNIGGVGIKTKGFKSYFTREVNEETGELKMNWKEPFSNAELNQAYKDGVNEVYWAENTEEKNNYRLRVEVPEIKAERLITNHTKRMNKLYAVLVYLLPIVALYIAWHIASGLVFGVLLALIYYLWKFLKNQHYAWKIEKHSYLNE